VREALHIEHLPELNQPILILGFEGWANGGNVVVGMKDGCAWQGKSRGSLITTPNSKQ